MESAGAAEARTRTGRAGFTARGVLYGIVGIVALFVGGFAGRAILDQIGSAGALGVGTGIRVLIAIWWLFVPGKPTKQ